MNFALFTLVGEFKKILFPLQWANAVKDVMVNGTVLLVDEKPQAMMYHLDECLSDTNAYSFSPIYKRFNHSLNYIIAATDGNVDNQ